jgi:SpoIID/LytB domain protein
MLQSTNQEESPKDDQKFTPESVNFAQRRLRKVLQLPIKEFGKQILIKVTFDRFCYATITAFCLVGLTGASGPSVSKNQDDVELRIGVVQRFGDDPKEMLQLQATKGDRLRLNFKTANGDQAIVTEQPLKMEVTMQPIQSAVVEERLVLGTFRTYETAEDNAKKWKEQGIEVEIAQPERWQVWAKRDTYSTPLVRRLLMRSLKSAGKTTPQIETQILKQLPKVSWVVNGVRYSPNNLEITSDQNLVLVSEGVKKDDKNPINPEKTRLYPGRLKLQPNAYGTYTLVNEVPLETYLRGVVPYEIGTNAPVAALEAQAILARTYVLRNLRRFATDNYQLCADTHCQVYYGLKGISPATDKAIASTRGMVLTYKNELVDALYSASTGGVTASFTDVWYGDDRPYLRPIVDSANDIWNLSNKSLTDETNFQAFINQKDGFNDSGWQLFRWKRESSLEDIAKGLQKFLKVKNSPYAKLKEVRELKVAERSQSGRILKLDVTTDIGEFSLRKDEVRSAFYAPISTLFYLQPVNKGEPEIWGYAFVGGGMGHGVGLSQTGAQNLAKLGWTTDKILQFYYPGTELQALNEKIKR